MITQFEMFPGLSRAAKPLLSPTINFSRSLLQRADMRAFRALHFQKHQFNPSSNRPLLNPPITSCKYSPNPRFSRHLWSTPRRMSPEESTAVSHDVNGWGGGPKEQSSIETFYEPTTGRVVTRRAQSNNEASLREAGSSTGNEGSSNSMSSRYEYGSESRVYGEVVGSRGGKRKGKGKSKTVWVCSDCGNTDAQWWGVCKECNAVNTLKQFSQGDDRPTGGLGISEKVIRSWLPQRSDNSMPMKLSDVNKGINQINWRIPLSGLFGAEVERVLGGGLVPGSLVLVGGDPGVGKSTLLLQIAAILGEGHGTTESAPIVYVSGEESIEQIGNRADRMRIGTEQLFLYTSTDVEDILEKVQRFSPRALIIDSIQTVYLRGVAGSAGGLTQVKECTEAFLRFAKKTNVPVLLAGHVTKSGEIAGPRVLEHIVDAVLYMEGEKYSSHRLLRSVKNRFGSTDELGVFQMSESGLQAVASPSEMFLSEEHSDSDVLAGLAVAVVLDGSRAFVIEIQALSVAGLSMSRAVQGVQSGRADLIVAVLTKQAGLKLQGIFLNVISGFKLTETAGDLAIAAAICSSFLECPVPVGFVFIGEIGLGGELRTVPLMDKRVNTVAKLGYKKCVVPKSAVKSLVKLELGDIEIVGCSNLKEMINVVF
ncbi:PREDICTED: uncharacterized protein LOC109190643 isoform X2 [Ipomoea nil]|uniref:uncharacterized protein LOC109190643 isoform X2 n=1 Tax=Ipomoea nil TaxID=35883 RepID=UPI000901525F|nr:PREDICTED: uncharacterized protein LOC109190643 isoform X2 [Ipomoea nil]